MKSSASLRYRYEIFSRDEDTVTPPNAESKASTLRLGVALDARINEHVGGFLELESVHQVGEEHVSTAFGLVKLFNFEMPAKSRMKLHRIPGI
jgi:hypothetical protein